MNRYKLSKAGINPNEGIERFGGNKETYERLLEAFPDDVHYQNLLQAIADGDVKESFQQAHALKGMTGNLSMTELYNALLPLVEEFRSGKMEQAESLLEPVSQCYEKVVTAIRND